MNHTPGPWKVGYDQCTIVDSGEHFVATSNTGVSYDSMNFEEQEANARLIAAAPKLLEALERAVVNMEELSDRLDLEDLDLNANWLPSARAAIRKARGE